MSRAQQDLACPVADRHRCVEGGQTWPNSRGASFPSLSLVIEGPGAFDETYDLTPAPSLVIGMTPPAVRSWSRAVDALIGPFFENLARARRRRRDRDGILGEKRSRRG